MVRTGQITQDQLSFALAHNNNVALDVRYLLQIHKPGRFDSSEFDSLTKD